MKLRCFSTALLLTTMSLSGVATAAPPTIIDTQTTSTPHSGVTLIEGKTRSPSSSRFHAAIVKLCHAGVRVEATKRPAANRTVPAFAVAEGASVAVNGDFYRPGPRVYGLAVGKGELWPVGQMGIDPAVSDQWYYDKFGWIAFGDDWVDFTHTGQVKRTVPTVTDGYEPNSVVHTIRAGTRALVSGFPELVTEGKTYACTDPAATTCFPDRADMRTRNPRTAMGLSKDRQTFILAVVDGRSATSAGMFGTDLAQLMTELGAWQAFNLDGGGSSEMWVKGRGTINKPSDGSSRSVANHWGIFTGTGAAAHCMPSSTTGSSTDEDTPNLTADTPLPDSRASSSRAPSTSSTTDDHPSLSPAEAEGCTATRGSSRLSWWPLVAAASIAAIGWRRRRR